MKTLKLAGIALAGTAAVAVLVPGAAFAAKATHSHHKASVSIVTGSISAFTAGGGATVNGVSFTFGKHTKYVAEDASASQAGPAATDSAVALLVWHKGTAVARRLEFGTAPFAYARREFAGRVTASTAPDTNGNGSLTVTVRGKKHGGAFTLNTNAQTKFFQNGKAVAAPTFTTNERVEVRALAMSDGSWDAASVRFHVRTHKGSVK